MRTVNLQTDIPENREIRITLPADVPTGPAEVLVVVSTQESKPATTFADFLNSEFAGMWRDRTDIGDGADFGRQLRETAWKRSA